MTDLYKTVSELGNNNMKKDNPYIIIKLNKSYDVPTILSKRWNLSSTRNVSINPDLSPSDREIHSILLKDPSSKLAQSNQNSSHPLMSINN